MGLSWKTVSLEAIKDRMIFFSNINKYNILVVGRLIELVDHYSFRAIRFDHRYFFLYSINRYKLLYQLVNCFKIDLHISHHTVWIAAYSL